MPDLIAAFVTGPRNVTRVSQTYLHCDAGIDALAKRVAAKEPGRIYHVYRVASRKDGVVKLGEPLLTWHVGEGFTHKEGWWVHA